LHESEKQNKNKKNTENFRFLEISQSSNQPSIRKKNKEDDLYIIEIIFDEPFQKNHFLGEASIGKWPFLGPFTVNLGALPFFVSDDGINDHRHRQVFTICK
jgi:hypothetical protein